MLRDAHDRLLAAHGPQHWWPGETPFEVMVGAILTQNTAWTHVERAIANLKREACLDPAAILERADLPALLRPSGYFNVKANRLRSFCRWVIAQGGEPVLRRCHTPILRARLLSVPGIGPETADDILLYAFDRAVFVIDAYTRRIFSRMGSIRGDEPYDSLRDLFERAMNGEVAVFREFHALIVRHGKDICRTRPRCAECCLQAGCAAAAAT